MSHSALRHFPSCYLHGHCSAALLNSSSSCQADRMAGRYDKGTSPTYNTALHRISPHKNNMDIVSIAKILYMIMNMRSKGYAYQQDKEALSQHKYVIRLGGMKVHEHEKQHADIFKNTCM